MAHGHVAVHAHHGQGEDAGEHVVVIDGDEDFARHLAKRPGAEQVVGALEGHGGGDQSVGHSQVEDVDVGGCFHLGVSVVGEDQDVVLLEKKWKVNEIMCSVKD